MFSAVRNSLRIKLILMSMIVEAIMLVLLLGNSLRIIDTAIEEQTELRIQAASPLLNAAVSIPLIERNYSTLIDTLETLHSNKKHNFDYIAIIDDQNEVYAQVGVKGEFPLDGSYVSPSQHIVSRSSDVSLSGEVIGKVYYGLSIATFMESKDTLLIQGIIIAITELFFSLILLLITGYFLTKNLDSLLKQVVDNEKMSSLGSLVAGVAHEINTPVGISLTGVTHIQAETKTILQSLETDKLGKNALMDYLKMVDEMSSSLQFSLNNASQLVRSFKQVAVDQNTEEARTFNLKEYCDDVILSLHTKFRHTDIKIVNAIDEGITINSYAGIFSQVISNLMLNSLLHAFEKEGTINIKASIESNKLHLTYTDDGKGMEADVVEKMFDPFFSTKMGQGGSGLGLNIIYNLINYKLNGSIKCYSKPDQGMKIDIIIPMKNLS